MCFFMIFEVKHRMVILITYFRNELINIECLIVFVDVEWIWSVNLQLIKHGTWR